jgi:hypothetical protein
MRRARDTAIADVASGKTPSHLAKIADLPVNCRWVRHASPRGVPDGPKQIGSANLGYRKVGKADVAKQPWLTALPPGAEYAADGSITKGDCTLMVADQRSAARNAARKAAATSRMVSDTAAAAGGLLQTGAKRQGSDPFVTQE